MPLVRRDRFLGCLLGLAAGDAVGTAVEFKPRGTFPPVMDMAGGGPFALRPGEWTDDTSMALCLAESIFETGGFDPADQARRYLRWYREGHLSSNGRCFDIGRTTRDAIQHFESTGDPFSGLIHEQSAGNGSIMRLAPVPMRWVDDPETAIRLAGESSRTTHALLVCVDACRFLAALIVGALRGVGKEALLSLEYTPTAGLWDRLPLHPEIDGIACGSYKGRDSGSIRGSGYVVRSLEAALWAFHQSKSFEEGCLLAVNLGEDADTTAAVYGQIAGAFYGAPGIPQGWLEKLAKRDVIERLALAILIPAIPEFNQARRLIHRLVANEDGAWEEFFQNYAPGIRASINGAGANDDNADDIFAYVIESLHVDGCRRLRLWEGRNGARLSTYLFTVARHLTFDYLAREPDIDVVPLDEPPEHNFAEGMELGPEHRAQNAQLIEQIRNVLDQMHPEEQELLVSVYIDGESASEIAQRTGRTRNAVYQAIFRAKQRFRDIWRVSYPDSREYL